MKIELEDARRGRERKRTRRPFREGMCGALVWALCSGAVACPLPLGNTGTFRYATCPIFISNSIWFRSNVETALDQACTTWETEINRVAAGHYEFGISGNSEPADEQPRVLGEYTGPAARTISTVQYGDGGLQVVTFV